jgi:RNA recognition motif-containing protein
MPLSQTNIYVRGLPPDFTNDDLRDLCAKFGRIVSTKAVVEPESNKCRGYGFIDFESPQAASQALSTINSEGVFEAEAAKELRGRSIDRHLEQDPTNLYIANLPRDYTEFSIREMLSPYGMVISTRVLRNPDGSSRCVGFARMETKQCCDQIISYYNGKKLSEDSDPLVVKLADSARRPKHSTSSSGQSSSDQVK